MRLATGCQLAEVSTAALSGHSATLLPQDSGCGQLGLRYEIVSEGECRTEEFAAFGSSIFGQRHGGENKIGFGYQPFQGV